MTPSVRKLTLTVHISASVGWAGALAVFLAHALGSLMSQDEQIVRGMSIAMGVAAWFVILPLALASLTTGLIQALGTAWGLFRHYWVVFKMLLTTIATVVLLLKLAPISYLADLAKQAEFAAGDLTGLRRSLASHAAGGLLILLTAAALAIYKPAGMIRSGAAMPRWVKVFCALAIVLIMLVAIMVVFGGHGPGAHLPTAAK